MDNQEIQTRLQHLIDMNKIVSKQLAFKTKRLHKQLNFFANATAVAHHKLHEKRCQLMMTDKMLAESRDMLESLKVAQETSGKEVHRLQKKMTGLQKQSDKPVPITEDDQFVFTKNKLKLRMLGDCTKLQYHDTKSPNHISLIGYSSAAGQLHTLDEKIPTNNDDDEMIDSPANEKMQSVLWNHIKLGSQHLDEWSELFSADNTDPHTTI